jgi:anti-sigma-K factor RskA
VLAVAALVLAVAAAVARPPADFAQLRVGALLRDNLDRRGWAVRLAPASDQIALDHLAAPPPPAGKVFQLWLAGERGEPPQPLGLLPSGGRKIVAEAPAIMRRLPCATLTVTLEPATGGLAGTPSGAVVFRAEPAAGSRPPGADHDCGNAPTDATR